LLAREVGERQLLQIALLGLRREVAAQRGLDVMHPRMLALDQVGVIAMHPSGDLDQVLPERAAHAALKAGRLADHRAGEVLQGGLVLLREGGLKCCLSQCHYADLYADIVNMVVIICKAFTGL
jgi:hypothetical protein